MFRHWWIVPLVSKMLMLVSISAFFMTTDYWPLSTSNIYPLVLNCFFRIRWITDHVLSIYFLIMFALFNVICILFPFYVFMVTHYLGVSHLFMCKIFILNSFYKIFILNNFALPFYAPQNQEQTAKSKLKNVIPMRKAMMSL